MPENETPNRFIPSPAVRAWLYNVMIALVPVGVFYGLVTVEEGGLWLTVASAIFGVGVGTARANVPR